MAYRPDYSPIGRASQTRAQVLTGLGGQIGGAIKSGRGERKEEARLSGIKGLASKAMGGDVAAQDELAYTSPEISKRVMEVYGAKTEQQQKGLIHDFAQAASLANAGSTEEAVNYLGMRIEAVNKRGGDSTHTTMARDALVADPGKGTKYINNTLRSMVDPKSFVKGEEARTAKTPSTAMAAYIKQNPDATDEDLVEFTRKLSEASKSSKDPNQWAPSPLKKLITERQALLDSGVAADDDRVKAYDNKITGVDIDLDNMTPAEIEFWGAMMISNGKMPSFGRGKQATKIRQKVAKSAARQALGADADGVPEGTPEQTPAEAALEVIGTQSDTKAIQGSLNFLDKQLSSMGSFVTNLNSQVDKVGELSKDLETFDTRLLNKPLRMVRRKLAGSPLQAKYDMYLAEIESEIGKLATGSTGSVAELSATAQDKWSHIHDKNLSVKDMMSLLEETRNAANFRVESVRGQLDKTRARMRTRDYEGSQVQRNIVEVENPQTGEMETWDLTTEQRVK